MILELERVSFIALVRRVGSVLGDGFKRFNPSVKDCLVVVGGKVWIVLIKICEDIPLVRRIVEEKSGVRTEESAWCVIAGPFEFGTLGVLR